MQAIGVTWIVAGLMLLFGFLTGRDWPLHYAAWKDVWPGAAVTALLFTVGKYLVGLYLARAAFVSAYGAAGSLVAVQQS